jgi:hypothetical protein
MTPSRATTALTTLAALLTATTSPTLLAADATAPDTTPAQKSFPQQLISVTSPDYRAEIAGDTTVAFIAPGLAKVTASCWKQGGEWGSEAMLTPEPITLAADGTGSVVFPAKDFPHGPMVIKLTGYLADGKKADYCYLELFNKIGVPWHIGLKDVPVPPQCAGMTQTYADDFTAMPKISQSSTGAVYGPFKADGGEYGDAAFGQQGSAHDPFYQTEDWLRIRTFSVPELVDKWKRKYVTGFLCSLHEDGKGFHTGGNHDQYFECRMTFGAAPGMWAAFWTLSANNYKSAPPAPCDELDIIESYAPWQDCYHTTRHEWSYQEHPETRENPGEKKPFPSPVQFAAKADLSQTFHTFGLMIAKDTTTYYCDNVPVFSHPTQTYSWKEGNDFMINASIQGGFFHQPSLLGQKTDWNRYGGACDLWIDWVRVYERP